MNNQELIATDITKKQKSVIAQRKYRERLKSGKPSKEGSEMTYETYKKTNVGYMRKYHSEKKIVIIKPYAEENPAEPPATTQQKIAKVEKLISITALRQSGRENKQIDLCIQTKKKEIVKPTINKQVVPKWKKNLPVNVTEADKVLPRAYKEPARTVMVKKVKLVMENVLLLPHS